MPDLGYDEADTCEVCGSIYACKCPDADAIREAARYKIDTYGLDFFVTDVATPAILRHLSKG